jgi:hypothetical protein
VILDAVLLRDGELSTQLMRRPVANPRDDHFLRHT